MKITCNNLWFGVVLLLTLTISCQSDSGEKRDENDPDVNTEKETPSKMIEQLVGEWSVVRILNENGEAVTERDDEANQTLTFTPEARYIMRSGNEKVDSGAYRMNEQLGNLYLESEANEEPREWNVEMAADTMVLTARQNSEQGRKLRYVYKKQ